MLHVGIVMLHIDTNKSHINIIINVDIICLACWDKRSARTVYVLCWDKRLVNMYATKTDLIGST